MAGTKDKNWVTAGQRVLTRCLLGFAAIYFVGFVIWYLAGLHMQWYQQQSNKRVYENMQRMQSLQLALSSRKHFEFDGHRTHVVVPHIPFDEYEAFTIEAWLYNWREAILCQGHAGDPENSLWLSMGENRSQPHESCGWESNAGENSQSVFGALQPDQWHHVAMVFDGTRQIVFVDGYLKQFCSALKPGRLNETRPLIIGAHQYKNLRFGSGRLLMLRISRVARYSSNFEPQPTLGSDSDTVLLYDFSLGEHMTVRDLSNNGRDGAIVDVTDTVESNDNEVLPTTR